MAQAGDPAAAGAGPAPLVSVVVATFNSRLTLACALDSVRRQSLHATSRSWVVGDACTDGSEAVVAALGDPRFHWTNLPRNSGSQAGPNNEGLRRARGRFVAYLGHDDLWFPWHLETLVDTASSEGASFVHGLGVILGPGSIAATGPPRRGASYRGHSVPPTNWLVERALLERIGPWREPGAIGRPVDVDVLDRIAATGAAHRLRAAPDDDQVALAAVAGLRARRAAPADPDERGAGARRRNAGGAPPVRGGRRARPRHVPDLGAPAGAALARRGGAREDRARRDASTGGSRADSRHAPSLAVPAPPPPGPDSARPHRSQR